MDVPVETHDAIIRVLEDLQPLQSTHDSRLLASVMLMRAAAIFSTLRALNIVTDAQVEGSFRAAAETAMAPPLNGADHVPVHYGTFGATNTRQ